MEDEFQRDWKIYRGGFWFTPEEDNKFDDAIPNPNNFLTFADSVPTGFILQEDDGLILQEDRDYIFY